MRKAKWKKTQEQTKNREKNLLLPWLDRVERINENFSFQQCSSKSYSVRAKTSLDIALNSKIISYEIKGKPRALFCCNDSRLPKKIDHIIVRFLAKFASITCDSFNGR